MKTIKPYLFFIFLAMLCADADAQIYNGRFYRLLQGPQALDFGRFKTELVPPYQLSPLADTGSIAFSNNKWYGKKGDSTWVELGGSSTAPLGSTHIETTGSYTIPDSVNNVILQYAGGTSITLPDPAAYDKREITIRNVSGNGATFNYSLVYSAGNSSDELATGKWVRIKSDGEDWRVTQESGSEGGGGGTNVTIINVK